MKQQLNMADVLRKAQQQVDSVIRMASILKQQEAELIAENADLKRRIEALEAARR